MNLACLVERDRVKEFEAAVIEAARGFDNHFAFDFNGRGRRTTSSKSDADVS